MSSALKVIYMCMGFFVVPCGFGAFYTLGDIDENTNTSLVQVNKLNVQTEPGLVAKLAHKWAPARICKLESILLQQSDNV